MSDMPKEIYLDRIVTGNRWFSERNVYMNKKRTQTYTRKDPDTLIITRQELEEMRMDISTLGLRHVPYASGSNELLDKLIARIDK